MTDPNPPAKSKDYLRFPRDWWQFLRGPGNFFASVDLNATEQIVRSLKHLGLGLTGAVVLSLVNLKLVAPAGEDDLAKVFQGSVLANTLLVACLISSLIALVLSRLCGSREKPRRLFIAYAYMNSFVWPTLTIVVILSGWLIRWMLGVPWVELPPLGGSQGIAIERTFGNILLVAVPVTAILWGVGFVAYAYVRSVMSSQKLGAFRACLVALGNVLVLRLIERPLGSVAHTIAEVLDPLIGWIWKLL